VPVAGIGDTRPVAAGRKAGRTPTAADATGMSPAVPATSTHPSTPARAQDRQNPITYVILSCSHSLPAPNQAICPTRTGPCRHLLQVAVGALADAGLLRTLAADAGFTHITIVTETRTVRFASVSDYVRIQLTATPLASLLQHQPGRRGQRLAEVLIADVAVALQPYQTPAGLAFPQQAHVLVADR
jgi:hypothetical protein